MASVYSLSRALGVRPGDLLPAVLPQEVVVVRAGEGRIIPVADHPAAAFGRALLLRSSSALEIIEYSFGPEEYIEEWFESPGEGGLYVISGTLEVDIFGAGTYSLERGDFIHFPAGARDRWRLVGPEPAKVLFATSVGDVSRR